LRVSIREALDACRAAEASAAPREGKTPVVPPGASGLFAAMLMLVSDGQGEEMTHGPYAWQVVSSLLSAGSSAEPARTRPATASNCSTAASSGNTAGQSAPAAIKATPAVYSDAATASRFAQLKAVKPEVPVEVATDGRQLKQTSSLPYLLLPRPRRVGEEEGSTTPRGLAAMSAANAWGLERPAAVRAAPPSALIRTPSAPHTLYRPNAATVLGSSSLRKAGSLPRRAAGEPPRENLVCKLSDLKDKVDWLAEEMAKLGDKRKDQSGVAQRSLRRDFS